MAGPEDLPPAGVPPHEAIAFFKSKGFRIGFAWEDVFQGEHVRAFTVAKAMKQSVLEAIRAEVDRAISDGTTFDDFRKTLRPKLEALGWWGRKQMIDPATGQSKKVQLGSNRRLKTIFDTNLRTSYAAGRWERAQRVKSAFPFMEYRSMEDDKVRPEHNAWDGTILPIDDPWWDTHYPPCDWACRCTAIPRSQRMLDRQKKKLTEKPPRFPDVTWVNTRTGETGVSERGIGKGWAYNVGKEHLRGLAPKPLPESFGRDEGEVSASAQFRNVQLALVDRFLKRFGIDPGRYAIWMDRDGWPLPIGRSWFIAENGAVRMPGGSSAGVVLDRIAAAIVTPDSIRWIWVRAENGELVLMRRYARISAGLATIVDIGRIGWRWRIARAADVEQLVAAAYNPHQKRDRAGRFARMHGPEFLAAVADPSLPHVRPLSIGVATEATFGKLRDMGIAPRGEHIVLERSHARHILKRHGPDAWQQPGHRPVTLRNILGAHRVVNQADRLVRVEDSRDGNPGVRAIKRTGRTETHVIFTVRRRGLVVETMYRREIGPAGERVKKRSGGKKSPA
ncbi:phage minor head protein [Sphingomonas sp. AOB5]|uniref:phage minor head protein n=1 Tax=Sphingomonas sp. AOB5 TaxID=3034017 RepID=UPI0023F96509|nr:phage minor head protein [Sphingomonas sp. AOB5]MDF7776879.1 phage minor head protein [Sphingomonas sp. AOB5]